MPLIVRGGAPSAAPSPGARPATPLVETDKEMRSVERAYVINQAYFMTCGLGRVCEIRLTLAVIESLVVVVCIRGGQSSAMKPIMARRDVMGFILSPQGKLQEADGYWELAAVMALSTLCNMIYIKLFVSAFYIFFSLH